MKGYDLAAPGATVDADALALDGCHDRYSMERHVRFGRDNVFYLEGDATRLGGVLSVMAQHLRAPGWVEVAEAIGELEALADWRPTEADALGGGFAINALAEKAFADTVEHLVRSKSWSPVELAEQTIDMTLLEAAARLRDGWRPRGWRRKHTKEKTK